MPHRRKLLNRVLFAIAALLATAVVALWLAGPQALRAQVESIASSAVGRPIRIAGPLAWSFEHGPGLRAGQVSLGNPGWARGEAFAQAQSVEVAVSVPDLLRGGITLALLRLDGVSVDLERDGERVNWAFSGGGGSFGARVEVNGLSVSYASGADQPTVFELPDLRMDGGDQRSLTADASFATDGGPLAVSITGPTLSAVLDDPRVWPLTLDLQRGAESLRGKVSLDLHGDRPRLRGKLALELPPISGPDAAVPGVSTRTGDAELARLGYLNRLDGDVELSVISGEHRHGLAVTLHQGRLDVVLPDGIGRASVDAGVQPPRFEAGLHTGPVDLGTAFRLLGLPVSHFVAAQAVDLTATSHGDTVAELLAQLRGTLTLSQLTPGPQFSGLEADTMRVTQDNDGLGLKASARWTGHPFTIDARGGSIATLLDIERPYPFENHVRIGDNRFDLDAELSRSTAPELKGKLVFKGGKPAELDALLGVRLPAALAYDIRASLYAAPDRLSLSEVHADIGRSRLRGALTLDSDGARPKLHGKLVASHLRLSDLGVGATGGKAARKLDHKTDAAPEPAGIATGIDAEIELQVAAFSDVDLDLSELRTTLRLEQGSLAFKPLRARLFGIALQGHSRFDNSAKGVAGKLVLNLPAMSQRLAFGRGKQRKPLQLDAGGGRFQLASSGSNGAQWLQNLTIDLSLKQVRAQFGKGRSGGRSVTGLDLGAIELTRRPGRGFIIHGRGTLDGRQVTLSGKGQPLAPKRKQRELTLGLSAGDLQLGISGLFGDKLTSLPEQLMFNLRAQRPASLPAVLHSPWTARGPYRLDGRLLLDGDVVRVRDLDLRFGNNDLAGRIDIDSSRRPIRLDATLTSVRLEPGVTPRFAASRRTAADTDTDTGTGTGTQRIIPDIDLLPSLPAGWDAGYHLKVAQLALPHQTLHDFELRGSLEGDHLVIDPLRARLLPAGGVRGSLDARVTDGTLHSRIDLEAEQLDLGWVWTKDEVEDPPAWPTSFQLALQGRGNRLREYLADASGGLRFMGGHMDLDTDALDLWTTDLISIAIPRLLRQKDKERGLLCSVLGFKIDRGVMHSQGMLFNTSAAVVLGSGTVSLADEKLNLVLAPEKKRFSLLSVATPVALTGTLADPKVGVAPQELALTAGAVALSVVQPWVLAGALVKSGYHQKNPCLTTFQKLSDDNEAPDASDPFSAIGSRLERSATRTLRRAGRGAAELLD